MSIKTTLAKTARRVLPRTAIKHLETTYRTTRIKLVSARYGHPAKQLKIIAITGTNGKTTTANYLNEILKISGLKTALFSTATIEIAGERKLNDLNLTVPPVAQLQRFFRDAARAHVDYVILEATSQGLHQRKFLGVPFHMAVLTNITEDHLDYHQTMDAYAKAKALLFAAHPAYIVLNTDSAYFDLFNQYDAAKQKITYGRAKSADFHIDRSKLYPAGVETYAHYRDTKYELATSIPGEFNIYNMTAAAAAAALLGIDAETIADGIAELSSLPGRYEILQTKTPYTVVVDYAHTPDGLERLLKSAKETTKGRVILVFGSMGERDRPKRPIMGRIAAAHADLVFVTDEENDQEPRAQIRAEILRDIKKSPKVHEIDGRSDAIRAALETAKKGDTILITGLGHEVYRLLDGQRIHWADQEIVMDLLSDARA
jgi:UDP-N-acetylmuramoyl-L-alanyl-D-glutamate--2,6-diaminopimelate ligase